ncbi:Bug family tripartite tricarboxylate transporter substrate binding protein [Comamonas endophytica]|uniref:Tripartite tricarboxylate transporter substrate binding protein n=1 Tax=Comamonas endophytica TaxID=2949090 RepID=A0ABY6GFF3_9BURK|nr:MULTISPECIES: tripartite tricarboxylate transporter substrate binding protein [unclassified Acidovorax]MCD2514337.1 tripartite tricarboxylate transporter substrate binding protein [Acidovorax sp. D4N7]UYG53586.1 tripartite tricarboxylate transporter substrate binding protein [Acidovorax sp. 5MLIR]UYG53631.1 tripartite tricarboxylate transporter substrate binding protein [Acidovorax sp. 5MLIR]
MDIRTKETTQMHANQQRRFFLAPIVAMVGALAIPGAAWSAQEAWPSRTITYTVPFTPGGATDIIGRLYSVHLAKMLDVPVVVENIGGTGGSIGSAKVARAKPDGYSIVGGTISSHSINASIYPNTGYDPVKSFSPIIMTGSLPNVLVVRADSPHKSVQDLINAARKTDAKLAFGSAGVGSSQHLTGELFNNSSGTKMLHVPYKGSGPALQALMGGEIDLLFDNITAAAPLVKAGTLRALAVTSKKESATLPGVKPLDQLGLPGFEVISWQAVFAPAGTPRATIDKLYQAMSETLRIPAVRSQLEGLGIEVSGEGPDALAAFQKKEVDKWAAIAKTANIKP